jgi:uncharacterized protein involved in outer membrane biogenesis
MKKLFVSVVVIILAVAVVLAVGKDTIAKVGIERGVELVTGLRLSIQKLAIGIINTNVGINDLKLYNPQGFEDKIMLNMPEIYVDYDLAAILRGKVHLPEMRINLQEFMVVKNRDGKLNLDSLKAVQSQKAAKKPAAGPAEKGKMPEIQIDKLVLKVGKVIYKDYSKGGAPTVKEFNVNINEEYSNITDPNKLVSLIVVKALMNTSIGALANFDVKGLQSGISDTLATGQKAITGALGGVSSALGTTGATGGVLQGTTTATKEAIQGTTETVKKTTEGLTETLKKLPFGSSEETKQ